MNTHSSFWFPAKRYGWGWGPPVRWQGWVILGLYLALVLGGAYYFRAHRNPSSLIIYLGCLTVALIAIIAITGEKPLAWRWGKK